MQDVSPAETRKEPSQRQDQKETIMTTMQLQRDDERLDPSSSRIEPDQ